MYKPLQIPNLNNKSYLEKISYTETMIPELSDYLICMWESYSYAEVTGMMTTVIVTDACIDLVIDITNDESMKEFLLEYLIKLIENARDTKYIRLFDDINNKKFIKAEP